MKALHTHCRKSFAFLRGPLLPYLKATVITFAVIWLLFYVVCLFRHDLLLSLLESIRQVVDQAGISDQSGNFRAWPIFVNNARASFLSMAYGLIPFLYLPALPIGMNAAILGALTASYQVSGLSFAILAAGLLPHGILELPALLIAFACGLYLCRNLGAAIRGKKPQSFSALVTPLLRVYLTVIVPLLAAAALIEAYVTPQIMALFY